MTDLGGKVPWLGGPAYDRFAGSHSQYFSVCLSIFSVDQYQTRAGGFEPQTTLGGFRCFWGYSVRPLWGGCRLSARVADPTAGGIGREGSVPRQDTFARSMRLRRWLCKVRQLQLPVGGDSVRPPWGVFPVVGGDSVRPIWGGSPVGGGVCVRPIWGAWRSAAASGFSVAGQADPEHSGRSPAAPGPTHDNRGRLRNRGT